MQTFVITGATGFIGRWLAELLVERRDTRVVALCRDGSPPDGCEIVRGEIEDLRTCERLVNECRPDGVFHLAAQAMVEHAKRDPFATMEANVRGTYNLLESFRRHRKDGARFVMASSDKAYGELPMGSQMYTEGLPLEGRGPYDVSKSCADLIAQSYGLTYSLPISIIRAGNVYGPGDRDLSRIFPSLMADIVNGRPLTIRSDGTPIRDYVFVDDVAKGYIAAWERDSGDRPRAYNLAANSPISVSDLADTVLRTASEWCSFPRSYGYRQTPCQQDVGYYLKSDKARVEVLGTRKGEIQKQVLDPTRAQVELGWRAETTLGQGITETLAWAYDNLRT